MSGMVRRDVIKAAKEREQAERAEVRTGDPVEDLAAAMSDTFPGPGGDCAFDYELQTTDPDLWACNAEDREWYRGWARSILGSSVLADLLAEARAEALREAADHYRTLGDDLTICAGHVVAELDYRADEVRDA